MISQHSHRKNEHVSLAEYFNRTNHHDYFNQVHLIPKSLPEIDYDQVDPRTKVGPLHLKWPFYIEAMTGGSSETGRLNAKLASTAKKTGVAMATGSESIALQDPSLESTFAVVRKNDPNGVILANLGASSSPKDVKKAIQILQANAVEIHVNAPQELIMPEGNRHFHWLANLQKIIQQIKIPVIIKEVGFGMSHETIRQLTQIGAKYINVSGRGGTNFAKIENYRRSRQELSYLADWGLTTPESLLEARQFEPQATIISSGGVKNPLDIVKAIVLGANAVGVAGTILHSLLRHGTRATSQMIFEWQRGIKIIMTMLGCQNISQLQKEPFILSPRLISYLKQRHLKIN